MLTSTIQLALSRAGYRSQEEFLREKNLPPSALQEALTPYLVGYELRRIRPGDTFWGIAREFSTSAEAIAAANPEKDPRNLQIGEILVVPLGFPVVSTAVPMTSELLMYAIRGLEARYPALTSFIMGKTAGGRRLPLLRVGYGPRTVFYNAAHHANEWITTPLLMGILETYLESAALKKTIPGVDAEELLQEASLFLVPMVNPDGVDLVLGAVSDEELENARQIGGNYPEIPFPEGWKANLRGTDLNLNYPAQWDMARQIKFEQGFDMPAPRDFVGQAPLSERETRAMFDVTEELSPDLTISWHTQGQEIYWKFLDLAPEGAEALGRQMARASGYALSEIPYASSFAGYKDWFIQDFDRPGYTIEAGLGENPLPISQLPQMLEDNLPIFLLGLTGGDPNFTEPAVEAVAIRKPPQQPARRGNMQANTAWG